MNITALLAESAWMILGFMTGMFILAQLIKDNSIVDIGWGIGFVLVAGWGFYSSGGFSPRKLLMLVVIAAWGIRLAAHIGYRNIGKEEDFRYQEWREEWGKWVIPRAFLQVFMLQGALMWIISLPIQLVMSGAGPEGLNWIDFAGAGVFLIGFLFEAIGDFQLMQFIAKPKPKPRFLTTGLWKYTRHPNYFGEAFLWWGVALIAIQSEYWWAALISPVILNFLLLKVSGIPMLEKKYEGNPEWEKYKSKTSAFFPWFPKSN